MENMTNKQYTMTNKQNKLILWRSFDKQVKSINK